MRTFPHRVTPFLSLFLRFAGSRYDAFKTTGIISDARRKLPLRCFANFHLQTLGIVLLGLLWGVAVPLGMELVLCFASGKGADDAS